MRVNYSKKRILNQAITNTFASITCHSAFFSHCHCHKQDSFLLFLCYSYYETAKITVIKTSSVPVILCFHQNLKKHFRLNVQFSIGWLLWHHSDEEALIFFLYIWNGKNPKTICQLALLIKLIGLQKFIRVLMKPLHFLRSRMPFLVRYEATVFVVVNRIDWAAIVRVIELQWLRIVFEVNISKLNKLMNKNESHKESVLV